jgi:hypothetical protein
MAKERESFNAKEGKITMAKEKERALVEGKECTHPQDALQQKGERRDRWPREESFDARESFNVRESSKASTRERKREIERKKERERKNVNMRERER